MRNEVPARGGGRSLTVIVSSELQAHCAEGVFLPPETWKCLTPWWRVLRRARLVSPAFGAESPPDGWRKVPDDVETMPLYRIDSDPTLLQRYRMVRAVRREALEGAGLLYLRNVFYEGCWVHRCARAMGIPLFLEFHGDWAEVVEVQSTNTLLRRLTRRCRARVIRGICRRLAAEAIAVSSIGPALAERYVSDETPVLVTTNNALEEREYRPRSDFALHDPPRILYVGAMQERKGLFILLDALSRLRERGRRWRLVLAGRGEQESSLRQYAAEKGLLRDMEFLGHVTLGPDLYAQYADADLLVLPSLAGEGVPRVLHEAMAFGCPVVATRIGSVEWQLQGGAGVVAPPGDVEALAEAIEQVLADEDRRRMLSQGGFAAAREVALERQGAAIEAFARNVLPPEVLT